MVDLVGQTLLERYRIDEFLGRGGMAEVYRAWDAKRSVYVALKVLNEDLAEDYVFLRRFAREARALELLQHPHVVRFFGFEEADDIALLVMEYIDGVTLRRQLKLLGRPLTLPEALAVLQPVCSALHYAHGMGIYHCDVKPANVFIERGGRVVLGDFGISRLTESATVTFSTPGTPAYMAPEQCRGEEIDARTDVYSLGITAYEMLTLDRPFKGETEETTGSRGERVRWEQMNVPPPRPRSVNPEITSVAEAAMLRALEKEPERRQQGALEFYQDLSGAGAVQPARSLSWVAEPEAPPTPPTPTPRESRTGIPRFVWAALSAVMLVCLAVILGVALAGRGRDDKVDVTTTATMPLASEAQTTTAEAEMLSSKTPSLTIASTPTPVDISTPTATFAPSLTPTPLPTLPSATTAASGLPPANANCGDTWVRPKDGMPMVYVPPGDLQMGSESGESDERPVHPVHLDGFWIDQFEITNLAFEQFVLETGYQTDAERAGWGSLWRNSQWNRVDGLSWRHPNSPNESVSAIMDHPVVQVSWNDANAYCEWVGGRLPTEAEWEMAARGAMGWKYPWGNEFDPARLNASRGGTVPGGSYEAGKSPCGAYDMAGNVWEWVNDWYQSDYYSSSPRTNPQGPTAGTHKALRGGAWDPSGGDSRSADRGALSPGSRGNTIGFRCARSPTSASPPASTPACLVVDGPFAAAWSLVQREIGCAVGNAIDGLIAEENFEGGKMFWREPIDHAQALVLFNDGTWRIFAHSPYIEGSPEFPCVDANTPAQCPPTPKRGFGTMWCDIAEIRNGLGNATDCERGYRGWMQQFDGGFMLQSDTGVTYVFYNDGRWERK